MKRLLAIATLLAIPCLHAEQARVKVSGFGLFGSAELRSSLNLLEFDAGPLDARKIDDGAFLLVTRLRQNGYLNATVSAEIEFTNGQTQTVQWGADFEPQLDEDLVAIAVHYQIHEGTLYYYETVEFDGLESIEEEEARSYFIPNATLYSRRKDRSYSPSILSNQQQQLLAGLASLGYANAQVVDQEVTLNDETGEVAARMTIQEGPLHIVRNKSVHIFENGERADSRESSPAAVYNRVWIEEQTRALRNESYHLGFPDTRLSNTRLESQRVEDRMELSVLFEVRRGKQITLTGVEHLGATDTYTPMLDRKSDLELGQPLDITEVESARRSISQLGIFDRVDLEYEAEEDQGRKVIFNYENSERREWALLAGYGSYERFRVGIIGRRSNIFGRAHSASFEAVQSMKSTTGNLNYTVPELLGESISGQLEASFLDREELYFDRTERGVSASLSTHLEKIDTDLALEYSFDRKRSSNPEFAAALRLEDTNIGSISLRATHNTIDNILYPSSGYELFTSLRYADESFGGETEFIRPELGANFHTRIGSRWIFHLSGRGGLVSSPQDNATTIPYGERFLIGGENTLRGYRRGEAGPVDETGVPIGAEAFALANFEMEYPIFDKLLVVLFVDSARVWDTTGDFDSYENFTNLGIGLRYRTIVGPVRLEYGHNLDPREGDPDGTLHLSIGFPF